jgi:hypothetical protein
MQVNPFVVGVVRQPTLPCDDQGVCSALDGAIKDQRGGVAAGEAKLYWPKSEGTQYASLATVEDFQIIGPISGRETIATGNSIRELSRLRATYGEGRWRKCKGRAQIQWHSDGMVEVAEVHWYEAHGVGAFEHKVKL